MTLEINNEDDEDILRAGFLFPVPDIDHDVEKKKRSFFQIRLKDKIAVQRG